MPVLTSLQKIAQLQAEIELLTKAANLDLRERRVALAEELRQVDVEIQRLTGKSLESSGKRTRAGIVGRCPTLLELKDLLSAVPGKTLNARKEGLDAKHVMQLAQANPQVLRMGNRGAWPEVNLVK